MNHVRAAEAAGAEVHTHETVLDWEPQGDGVQVRAHLLDAFVDLRVRQSRKGRPEAEVVPDDLSCHGGSKNVQRLDRVAAQLVNEQRAVYRQSRGVLRAITSRCGTCC